MIWLLWLFLSIVSPAHAQCNGIFSGATVCGTAGSTAGPPGPTATSAFTRIVWANDFGAVCNASTDDHVAFQNAINSAEASFTSSVRFVGNCKIASPGLSITTWVDFGGIHPVLSAIQVAPGSGTIITVNTANQVTLHDFGITQTGTASSGDTAIKITAPSAQQNSASWIWNFVCSNEFNCVQFQNASQSILRNSYLAVVGGIAVQVSNSVNSDSGDSTIYGNFIVDDTVGGTSTAGLKFTSGGGLRFHNNKILGFVDGINITMDAGALTEGPFIVGNSIEGYTTAGIHFHNPGAAGTLFLTKIDSNEIQGPVSTVVTPILEDSTGTPWLSDVTINSNFISLPGPGANGGTAINLQTTIAGLSIVGGVVVSSYTTAVAVVLATQTATNCVTGPFAINGTFTANTLSSCTSISPN